jgi:uncharacterized protein involved in exopolysaccharide biosynthesis
LTSTGRVPVRITPPDLPNDVPSEPVPSSEGFGTLHLLLPHAWLLWAHRRLLLRTALYAMLASSVIALLIPVQYQSVTRLMPPDSESGSGLGMLAAVAGRGGLGAGGLGAGALSGLAGDLLGMKTSGALFVGILGSETVQDRLIEQFQLKKVYGSSHSKIEDTRKVLAQHTEIGEDRKSGIISIGVTDHDPKRAAALAQAYVVELDRLVALVSTSSARRERIFLEGRLQKVKADLDSAARNFSDFASKNTAIDIPAQGKAMVEAAAVLQGQIIAAQAELSGLQQIYTDSNARVRALQARVNELNKKLNELGGSGTDGNANQGNSLYPSIRKLPILGVTYADLYRETKIQETVFELLTEQYELAKVQEAKEIPTVKVLDPALVPTKKSFPPRTVIVFLGTLLAIALMTTYIIGRAQWEEVNPSDPRKVFATEVFTALQARIPRFSRNGGAESNGHQPRRRWEKMEARSVGQNESEEHETGLD